MYLLVEKLWKLNLNIFPFRRNTKKFQVLVKISFFFCHHQSYLLLQISFFPFLKNITSNHCICNFIVLKKYVNIYQCAWETYNIDFYGFQIQIWPRQGICFPRTVLGYLCDHLNAVESHISNEYHLNKCFKNFQPTRKKDSFNQKREINKNHREKVH